MTLVADPSMPRLADSRPVVDVAVGILVQHDGAFLMTSRPEGKVYAGYWEFPGGKLEAGESIEAALYRELREELGIEIQDTTQWKTLCVDYPHALVRLHFLKVSQWQGLIRPLEGQDAQWQHLPVTVSPVLPGSIPVLEWLQEDSAFCPTHSSSN